MNAIAESRTTKLSLAIRLTDDYTGEQPLGAINVSINDDKTEAVKNPSEYYLFLNLTNEAYAVQVKSDFYFDEKLDVKLASLDPKNPIIEIVLKPNPAYPFLSGATLVRGRVTNQKSEPIKNAIVEIEEKNLRSLTDKEGEYVLYFPPLKESDLKKGTRIIKTKGDKKLQLKASLGNVQNTTSLKEDVAEGTTIKAPAIKLNISS